MGRAKVNIVATLTGPGGGVVSGNEHDSVSGVSDLYPQFSLKWAHGNHHVMAYTMWGVPVGDYDPESLANLGTNHWSGDAGAGYTYLNSERKQEFSATLGFTYNFENADTNYQNGIDGHLDFAASHFVSPTCHVGVAGYAYVQLSGDSGEGATLGISNRRSWDSGRKPGGSSASGSGTSISRATTNTTPAIAPGAGTSG